MNPIITRIDKGQFWPFHGGIHPPEQKFLTNDKPIRPLAIPEQLIIPVQQHIGQAGTLIVAVGDKVLKGQPLTEASTPMSVAIHAPTSGTISAIKNATIAHPSAMQELCVFIESDGDDKWRKRTVCEDFSHLSRQEIITKIAHGGVAGMGGAGFPTHFKVNTKPAINYLIINAAECEPYITADDLLMREHSASILDGIKILDHLLLPEYILIGIEDNKPEAIKALQNATKDYEKIRVCVLPTKYPTGGEKQLIQALTGQEVPSGVIPAQLGIVMQNVATCYAIADAVINDTPLIRRVVTVTGQALDKPQNVWAKIGTPVSFLLTQCGHQTENSRQIIMGGPMMGFSLPTAQVPVVKITNCLLVPSNKEISIENKEVECIRCGQCAEVCPSQLLPQEMQWSAKAHDYDRLKKLNLFDCIDCGACAYVCPSQIPLVQYYRVAKAEIRQQQVLEIKAEKAKARFEARKERLEREKRAREEKHRLAAEARRAKMNAKTPEAENAKSAVAAALARVKAKKSQATDDPNSQSNNVSAVATQSNENSEQSAQKSQVAAAIARAKAKKIAAKKAQQDKLSAPDTQESTIEKPLIANSDGKVEAKIDAKSSSVENDDSNNTEQGKSGPVQIGITQAGTQTNKPATDKKAQIAAAVAKAKAKKLTAKKASAAEPSAVQPSAIEHSEKENSESVESAAMAEPIKTDEQQNSLPSYQLSSEPNSEHNKADKIKAAIAKAKAKKQLTAKTAEQATTEKAVTEPATTEPKQVRDDAQAAKKQRIAQAIAKAKAKKQQQVESK
ncbi:MAG: electron transport complex subunit RsxC [Thalassotalea sp.]